MAVVEQSQPMPTLSTKQKQVGQSYWSLVWWKFRRNRVAVVGGAILLTFYISFVFLPEFISPYALQHSSDYAEAGPTPIHFVDQAGKFHLQPFVYGMEQKLDFKTRARTYVEDTTRMYPIKFFAKKPAATVQPSSAFDDGSHA